MNPNLPSNPNGFRGYIEIEKGTCKVWSGGEVEQICTWKPFSDQENEVLITCLDYTMNGFMAVCQVAETVRRNGAKIVKLFYPYFPYARQDRVMSEHEPFSLQTFCKMVNDQKFDKVAIVDPHSIVTPALLERCQVFSQNMVIVNAMPYLKYHNEFGEYVLRDPNMVLVSPDAGSLKKVQQIIPYDEKICIGMKKRTSAGVEISGIYHSPELSLEGKTCLIVDDICDGGRTFIEMGKALKDRGVAKVNLFVTHGIFSRGLDEIRKVIDHINTTNSWTNAPSDFVDVFDLKIFASYI